MMPPTTALNPIALAGSRLAVLRKAEMTSKMMNPANEKISDEQLKLCYSEFWKHCIQRHDLQEWDTTPFSGTGCSSSSHSLNPIPRY
jgi:hypothetical protein